LKDIREAGPLLSASPRPARRFVRRKNRERRRRRVNFRKAGCRSRGSGAGLALTRSSWLDDLRAALGELPEPQSAAFVLTRLKTCLATGRPRRWA